MRIVVAIAVCCFTTIPLWADTVAIIDRSPVTKDKSARTEIWDTLATTIRGLDSLTVISPGAVDSIVHTHSLNLDMTSPSELEAVLGAAKLLNVSIRTTPGTVNYRNHRMVKQPGRFTIGARLYDAAAHRPVAEFVDSCRDDGVSPLLLAKVMIWSLAPQLTPTVAPQRAVEVRDSMQAVLDVIIKKTDDEK